MLKCIGSAKGAIIEFVVWAQYFYIFIVQKKKKKRHFGGYRVCAVCVCIDIASRHTFFQSTYTHTVQKV